MNFISKSAPIVGAILILVPFYLIYLWFYAWNLGGGSHPKAVEIYNSYLPAALRGEFTSLISIGFSSLALILNMLALSRQTNFFRVLSIIIIIIAGLLAFANFWSMM